MFQACRWNDRSRVRAVSRAWYNENRKVGLIPVQHMLDSLSRFRVWFDQIGFKTGPGQRPGQRHSVAMTPGNRDWCVFIGPQNQSRNPCCAINSRNSTTEVSTGLPEVSSCASARA